MSFKVLAMVLTAALLHAFWNLLSKKTNGRIPFVWLMYIASSLLYLPILLYSLNQGETLISQPILWLSITSAILHIGYFLVLQKGYRSSDLSIVYPLARGTGPLFSCMAAILFLSEPLKSKASLGLALILAGVLVITGISFSRKNNSKVLSGVFWGILTGLFIALYTFNDALAIKSFTISPIVLTFVSNVFCTFLLLPFAISEMREVKQEINTHKWSILAIGLMSPAAYILVLEALKYAPLTVVAPARETSILFGVFMGAGILKERDGRRRLVASVLILAGIVLLSLN
ncbi:DMT family transporter [Pedobacter xixiisoli]|uniref:Uncharacterized membrane protein n=1 Tax=Pedobacter xixiisoli TaxID=1476464 RepID=A0A285ZWE4_9SPHI|nr:DMT family transporter [Pedobacter xixiisoli]SOD13964.1 Uncharacterized membrane protein [Pedobacter xixiisoli]